MKFVPRSKIFLKVRIGAPSWPSFVFDVLRLETRSITEPAGALALAALKRYIVDNDLVGKQKRFVAILSGANMNFDRLRFVAERAQLGEGREAMLIVEIPEKRDRYVYTLLFGALLMDHFFTFATNSFFALHSVIHPRATTELIYRCNTTEIAYVLLSCKLDTSSRQAEVAQIIKAFQAQGMTAHDIGDDEFMKSHARYMIGGPQIVPHERVFRFGKFLFQFNFLCVLVL
jgi:threonine dehydratase